MVQNGPNDHFGQNDLVPNRILALGDQMDQNGPLGVHFGLKRPILAHSGPPTVL